MATVSYTKSGKTSRQPKPPESKTLMVTTRDWRDGYGPGICGASSSRKWTNDYGKGRGSSYESAESAAYEASEGYME